MARSTSRSRAIPVATGQAKVGCFVGDHTRTGLGSMLNTGTAIGVMCNVLPAGLLLPKHIPSFCSPCLYGRGSPPASPSTSFSPPPRPSWAAGAGSFADAERQLYLDLFDQTRLERERAFARVHDRRGDSWPVNDGSKISFQRSAFSDQPGRIAGKRVARPPSPSGPRTADRYSVHRVRRGIVAERLHHASWRSSQRQKPKQAVKKVLEIWLIEFLVDSGVEGDPLLADDPAGGGGVGVVDLQVDLGQLVLGVPLVAEADLAVPLGFRGTALHACRPGGSIARGRRPRRRA